MLGSRSKSHFLSLAWLMAVVALSFMWGPQPAQAFEGTWRYYTASHKLADSYKARKGFNVCAFDGWSVENSGVPEFAANWRLRPTRISSSDPDIVNKLEKYVRSFATICNLIAVPWSDVSKRAELDKAAKTRLQAYEPVNSLVVVSDAAMPATTGFSQKRIDATMKSVVEKCEQNKPSNQYLNCACVAEEGKRRMEANELSTEIRDDSLVNKVLAGPHAAACVNRQGVEARVQSLCDRSQVPAAECACAKAAAVTRADGLTLHKLNDSDYVLAAFSQCQ